MSSSIAVITGGAGAFGSASAKALAAAGHTVVIADRDPEPVLARALFDSVAGIDLEEHLSRHDSAGGAALTG